MLKYIFLIFLFFLPFLSYSQSKIEMEERIKKGDAPFSAQRFVDSLNFNSKIKWFVEQGSGNKSYEAKTKFEGKKYSIEFDSLGDIEDIEVEVKWKQINSSTQNAICEQWHTDFEKFRIRKIQIQYSGKKGDLLDLKNSTENLIIKYEIVLKGQKNGETFFYEYLFSKEGELEKRQKFYFRNTDHLDY